MKNTARAILLFSIFSIITVFLFSICGEPGISKFYYVTDGQKRNVCEIAYDTLFYPAIIFSNYIFKSIYLSMLANVILYAVIVEMLLEHFEGRKSTQKEE